MTLNELGIEVQVHHFETAEEIMQEYSDTMWLDRDKLLLNENEFAEAFKAVNRLYYQNGLFYTNEGKKTEELLSSEVWESIKDLGIARDVERTTKKLMGAVKLASTVAELKVNQEMIPFKNGDLHLGEDWEFHESECSPTPYRFSMKLRNSLGDAPNFHKWLHDLFYEDDIITVQEYLGYCMVPTTKAQKALFLVGEGGAGKSVMGVILESILGDAMIAVSNTQEFLQDKFKLPELEHKLVLYDDDLDNEALNGTGLYKKLITNNLAITADRKYGQPFKLTPYAKLVACCNEMLTAKYDTTDGFFRRLLPIHIKPKAPDFQPDRDFYEKIKREASTITQWALVGLRRLKSRDWVLHESERSKGYLEGKKSIGNHFPEFMETVFTFSPGLQTTSADIMFAYELWCKKNALDPRSKRGVQTWLADHAEQYAIEKSTNIPKGNKRLNGYKGIGVKDEWMTITADGITIK